jgi:hypothetical protein
MFNIITPLARIENFLKQKNHLKNKNIKWHVITDEDSKISLDIDEPWISHYICPNKGIQFWERCNNSINWFIENHTLSQKEYYGILNDDDGYEDDFFKKIHEYIENRDDLNLLICSMKRGYNIPKDVVPVRRHPTNTLIASPNNMKVGGVGVEQFFIKGELLKKHRLPISTCGDGELITELVRTYKTHYLPDVFVLFNYFEPGRWNNT